MPIIRVDMLKGRTKKQKQNLVKELTQAFNRTCGENHVGGVDVWVNGSVGVCGCTEPQGGGTLPLSGRGGPRAPMHIWEVGNTKSRLRDR